MALGHLGINVADLDGARDYYRSLMPLVGYEPFLDEADQFAFRPAAGKPGTYLFFYPASEAGRIRASGADCSISRSWSSHARPSTRCIGSSDG